MIAWVEVASLCILILHWLLGRRSLRRRLIQSAAIATGAWLGEEISIRWEDAYRYAPGWHFWIDRVPLAVVLIWPSVVLSARAIANRLNLPAFQAAVFAGAVVWLDASLVEPISAHVGLWWWILPGPFGVSWVGPFGWGAYAFAISWRLSAPHWRWAAPVLAVALAQLLILGAYWILGRWLPAPDAFVSLIVGLSGGSLATVVALACRGSLRLPWFEALPRAAAALLFFGLLATHPDPALAVLAAGIAIPYLLVLPSIPPAIRRPRGVLGTRVRRESKGSDPAA